MNIVTVTLNPAIDQTILVNNFAANSVNRVLEMQSDPGGKGINVASFLADYGIGVTATGFLGEQNPDLFEERFAQKKIVDRFVRIPGSTRTNIKILDISKQQTTDINMAGQTPTAGALAELDLVLSELVSSSDWFVLSGNLPPGVPVDIYARMITMLKSHGKHVALDTSHSALAEGLKSGPDIVKPNIDELRQLTGLRLTNLKQVEAASKQLMENGVGLVVISMGKDGALFVEASGSLIATAPAVSIKSTVAAGDAMVAGLVTGKIRGLSLPECARLATAFSLGAIMHIGAHLPALEILDECVRQVMLSPLPND